MKNDQNYPLHKIREFSDFREMLDIAVSEAGDKPAFMYRENEGIKEISYRDFSYRVKALGTSLSNMGIKNEHIAMISENSFDYITVYYTVLCSNCVFIPIDKDLPFEEALNVLDHSDCSVIFFSHKFEDKLRENKDKLKKVRYFIGVGLDEDDEDDSFLSFDRVVDEGALALAHGSCGFWRRKLKADTPRLIVYTSGTTGTPKGVMLSQKNLSTCVYNELLLSRGYERTISVLPYHHTYELTCDILGSLHSHSTICINENLRTFGQNLLLYKPDYLLLVPIFVENLYKRVMKYLDDEGKTKAIAALLNVSNSSSLISTNAKRMMFKPIIDLFGGNLKKIICGGAPLRPELAEFFDSIGISLTNGYGITECSPLVAVNRVNSNDWYSAGTPLPCCDIKIDDPDENGNGEILVKSDTVMIGYYKNEEETKRVFDSEGYFRTGDYGHLSQSGFLYITGRKKNIIVLKNGKNIYPEEIEGYVEKNVKGVDEVIVYSLKNLQNEEVGLCSEIYPSQALRKSMNPDEIKNYLKKQIEEMNKKLPAHKNIIKIKVRETEFEKTSSGKIRRIGLGEERSEQ